MNQEDGDGTPRLAGLSVDDAVAAVAAEDDEADREALRETLGTVAVDGVVKRSAAESALSDLAMMVDTVEERCEMAAIALDDAEETAAAAPDLDAVRNRLGGFESQVAAVESRAAAVDRRRVALARAFEDDLDLYEVAVETRDVVEEAVDTYQTAEDLRVELGRFEGWVENPPVRVNNLEVDVEAVESAVAELSEVCDRLAAAVDDGPGDAGADAADLGLSWVDVALRHRVMDLFLADLRSELSDLRTWHERTDEEAPADLERVAGRIDDLAERLSTVGERLDDLAREAWTDRYGGDLDAFESTLAAFDVPVEWDAVYAKLDAARERVQDA